MSIAAPVLAAGVTMFIPNIMPKWRTTMSKIGNKEAALRAARLDKMAAVVCKIDHTADGAVPKELCAVCTPRPKTNGAAVQAEAEAKRDFRIPKGMSTAEGNAMLAQRDGAKKEKAKEALASLRGKQEAEFTRINALRVRNDLPVLPDKYIAKMKPSKPDANDKLFAKAEIQPMEKKMSSKTKTKSTARTAVKGKTTAKGNKPTKTQMILDLLKRKQGCTTADVLKATGWPSVSMPNQARMAGVKLKKEKVDGVTRYRAV
jgi:Protein of unknown function (DUF3489)